LSSDHAKAGAWLAEHRADVLAAIRACDRDGLRRPGTRLAAGALAVRRAGARSAMGGRSWRAPGRALAIADRNPAALAELMHRSAATFAEHGDRQRAEAQWVRALAVIRRAGLDPAAVLTALWRPVSGLGPC